MAMVEKKHRPSLTTSEVRLTVKWLDNAIRVAVQNVANINHSEIANLIKVKDYLQSFIKEDQLAALIKQYSAPAETNAPADVPSQGTLAQTQVQPTLDIPTQRESPINNPALTDDQKYDILALLDDNDRTEEENVWFLNVGTFVMMRRKGVSNTPVAEGDL